MNKINKKIYDDFLPIAEDSRGWNSNSNVFRDLIIRTNPSIIIEVGTWKGASAIKMGNVLKELNLNCKIYCVDTWLGALEFWTNYAHTEERDLMLKNGYPQIYYQFLSNVIHNNLQDYILPLPLPSNIAYKVLQNDNILADLVYIDASHEYEDVKSDIENYKKVLKKGGIMFGDDMAWTGVSKAANEIFGDKFKIIENNYWVYEN
jgi:predicted O-methyltransferase YrrM